MYVLVNWIASNEGFRPDVPADCAFRWLAGDSPLDFGLFEISDNKLSEADRNRLTSQKVNPRLAALLESCRVFPPALAGAVQDVKAFGAISRTQFVSELERVLTARMERQREAPFLLARSRTSELGYREEGEFVWVVNYNPDRVGREVSWVSSDFQVYSDAIDAFDLDPKWLASRFGTK